MTIEHACIDCGRPTPFTRCDIHAKAAQRKHNAKRLRGSKWEKLRRKVLGRDGNRCTHTENGVRCTATTDLEVHHMNGDRNDNRLSNLVVLCRDHHAELK